MRECLSKVLIVMSADYDDLFPMSVAVWSILKNGNKDVNYCFKFLVKEEFNGVDNGAFDKIREMYTNFSYQYVAINSQIFGNDIFTNQYITIETYFRLIISELFFGWDKCIYLDNDLIVQFDIVELLQIDLTLNYLAAVKDTGMQCGRGEYYDRHKEELEFKNMETYFNAGVLLFNLKELRQDNMTSKFLQKIRCNYSLGAQDILNIVCKGKILYLPLTYNAFSDYIDKLNLYSCGIFNVQELADIKENNIKIVNYAGGAERPWENRYSKKAGLWWRYAWEIPEVPWVEQKRQELLKALNKYGWENVAEKCNQYDVVFIYGYTDISKDLLYKLNQKGIKNIKFFLDKDRMKVGQKFDNVICVEPSEWIVFLQCSYLIVNCAQKSREEIKNALYNLGVPEDNIIDYVVKNKEYYRMLDKEFYCEELKKEVLCDVSLRTNFSHKSEEEKKEIFTRPENYFLYKKLYDKYFLFEWYVNSPLVSIIIPAYNVEKYIDRCLHSVWQQTYPNWECIVINDGSTDTTEVRIKEWVRIDRRFYLISQENAGMGQARNRGICAASGKYLTFVDADDWIEAFYLEDMLMATLRNNADVCKGNFFYHDMENSKVFEAGIKEEIDLYSFEIYRTPNMWCNLFAKRLFAENKIEMPSIPLEDLAVYPLLLLKAQKVVCVSRPLYHYQINTGSSVMDKIENIMYYPEAISYLLRECDRLGIREKYRDLLMDISWRHMNGSLNSRVKKYLSLNKFEECKEYWYEFMEQCFPGCLKHYNVKINR